MTNEGKRVTSVIGLYGGRFDGGFIKIEHVAGDFDVPTILVGPAGRFEKFHPWKLYHTGETKWPCYYFDKAKLKYFFRGKT